MCYLTLLQLSALSFLSTSSQIQHSNMFDHNSNGDISVLDLFNYLLVSVDFSALFLQPLMLLVAFNLGKWNSHHAIMG